jgi:hypothetical protein
LQKQHAVTEQSDLDGNVENRAPVCFKPLHQTEAAAVARSPGSPRNTPSAGPPHRKRRSKCAECCQDRCQTRFSVCLPSWPGGTNYLIALPERWVTVHSGDMGYTIGPFAGRAKCPGRSVTRWMNG